MLSEKNNIEREFNETSQKLKKVVKNYEELKDDNKNVIETNEKHENDILECKFEIEKLKSLNQKSELQNKDTIQLYTNVKKSFFNS